MKFVADECCDRALVELLRSQGHDVFSISESKPGIEDEHVLRISYDEDRILLTEDKDFVELVYRLRKPSAGIILLRISVEERFLKCSLLEKLLLKYCDRIRGYFIIVNKHKYRFRPLIFPA